jgi:hypothetical protein
MKFLYLRFLNKFSISDFGQKLDKITDPLYYCTYMTVIQKDEVEERVEDLLYRATNFTLDV